MNNTQELIPKKFSVAKRMVAPSVKGKKPFNPLYQRVWFLILMLVMITPIGVYLWLRYFRYPHLSIKIVVSILWLFWWTIFTIATIQVSTGNGASTTSAVRDNNLSHLDYSLGNLI